jgi:predicted O-methyltransferase YrrM
MLRLSFKKDNPVDFFGFGSKPVIRWIKGDGLDDEVTRAAIAHATRLFGEEVDYCLLTQGISSERARSVLSWAAQPVEWREISASDNKLLSKKLFEAGCLEENFGYWWKWFPERVRPGAPEWILDGDMVITKKPKWFESWKYGVDQLRVSQTNEIAGVDKIYGRYESLVDVKLRLYSGLISLPPNLGYMKKFNQIFKTIPLQVPHNGKADMCEQGIVAAAFQDLNPVPIPLHEFPFGRAFEANLDFGGEAPNSSYWGKHFGHAFRMRNEHFHRSLDSGEIDSLKDPTPLQKSRWLSGGKGQWGVAGWGISEESLEIVLQAIGDFSGKEILEIGTSRGRFALLLTELGGVVTTVDNFDRGARKNLQGLNIKVVISSGYKYLKENSLLFDTVVVDLHGNSDKTWEMLWPQIAKSLKSGGKVIINNIYLERIDNWKEETGVRKLAERLKASSAWQVNIFEDPVPGLLVLVKK